MEAGARTPALSSPPNDPLGRAEGPTVLPAAECWALLREGSVGRVGYVVDGWPIVVPVNYAVDGDDVVVRTDARSKLAVQTRHPCQLALEVDAPNMLFRSGWSVLALGVGREVLDDDELERLRSLPLAPWAGGVREHWIRIRLQQITGRRLAEQGRYPDHIR
jgi:nitroimidazol reductase NimA-like FMN-containing flavoprotein (pyridoxamine 5'-phosphate oxidase superfamily)